MSSDLELENPSLTAPSVRVDTLAGSVIILLSMTVVQRLIGFLRGVLVCRWLEPEQLGQWDISFGFLMLAAPLAVLGLPGSFGRYFEHYRQRGQLRTFLSRTAGWSAVLGCLAMVLVLVERERFSNLIYGRPDQARLVGWLAAALGVVIVHNFLVSLFIAARLYRVVTALQFTQTIGFAVLTVVLLQQWEFSAVSVVVAFMLASLLSVCGTFRWLRQIWNEPHSAPPVCQRLFWAKLVPFALWIWVTNLATNLFEVVDRYMIVHFSGLEPSLALERVGNYHSSRVVPLLFIGVAQLLGSLLTPHLSHDWEKGRHKAVVDRLNLVLKLLGSALLVASICVLLAAPYLFEIGFRSKFAGGLAILPWTLTYCAWFGISAVAINYLWCVERAGLSSVTLLVGLVVNVSLNSYLLPRYGLQGAVCGTTAAHLATLLTCLGLCRLHGMHVHSGTWMLALAPATLCLGPLPALGALLALVFVAAMSCLLFTQHEKDQVASALRDAASKCFSKRRPDPVAA